MIFRRVSLEQIGRSSVDSWSEKASHFVIPLWNLEERLSSEPFVYRSCEY